MLRDVEGLSVEENSEAPDISEPTVISRLVRARRKVQLSLAREVRSALVGAHPVRRRGLQTHYRHAD